MTALLAILLLVAAFLAGSIPFGFIVARSKGVDIRKHGSGNIGATNVGRVLGKKWGMFCFFLDFLKGLIPSVLAGLIIRGDVTTPIAPTFAADLSANQSTALWLGVAVCAVLGHMFTPWLGFKGGKGVATGFGALLGVYPVFTLAAIVAFLVWIIAVLTLRMIGLASVLAAIAMAIVVLAMHFAPASVNDSLAKLPLWRHASLVQASFAVMLALLVTYKHRANISRTLKGTEPKIGRKAPLP